MGVKGIMANFKLTSSTLKRAIATSKVGTKSSAPENHDELIQKIEEELTCAICLGKFNDPKVLPCLHTYCRKCVEDLIGKSQKKDIIVCPQCRGEHTLPVGGAGKLLTSFTFTNLVKLLEVHKADSKRLTCQNGLDDNPAVARCVECDVYLCNTCCQMHKKMVATKKHTIVSLEEIKATGEKCFHTFHFCPDHENEVLKLYCRTCSKTICGDCTYVVHRSHEYVFIKDIQEELRDTLSERLDTIKIEASKLKNEKEKADKAMKEHKTNVAAIHAEVDKKFEELSKFLKDCQAKIHGEIDVRAKKAEKPIAANVEEVESTLAHLMSNVSFIERLLKSSDACELATMASPTLEQCKKLEAGQRRKEITVCKWVLEGMEKSKEIIETVSIRQIEAVQCQHVVSSLIPEDLSLNSKPSDVEKKYPLDDQSFTTTSDPEDHSLAQPAVMEHKWSPHIPVFEQQRLMEQQQQFLLQQMHWQQHQHLIHHQQHIMAQQQVISRAAAHFNPAQRAAHSITATDTQIANPHDIVPTDTASSHTHTTATTAATHSVQQNFTVPNPYQYQQQRRRRN